MINPEHKLPVTRQAELLNLSRSSVYYLPRPVIGKYLQLMRLIDELHLEYPFAGTPVPQLCREHGVSSATVYMLRRG